MLKQIKPITIPIVCVGGYFYYKNKDPRVKTFSYTEVQKHNKEHDAWIIHKNNVYDVTDFIENHPGGKDKIMLAAGKSVDPFWNTYRQHLSQHNIQNILAPMKIGQIKNYKPATRVDPYTNDPIRNINLKFHSYQPCNAETPVELIADYPITPSDLWYVRNHHPVPEINIESHRLSINSPVFDTITLSVSDLQKIKETTIITTIQCGGNRRTDYSHIDKTSGTPWGVGAISTAKWTGVLLSDILKHKNIQMDRSIKHVHFESADSLKASVPVDKLMKKEILIAYKMNDRDIPRDHGYPLRAIVPGYVGVRNVKWLTNIVLSNKESDGVWQKSIAYKVLPSTVKDAGTIDSSTIPTMQEMPIQSAITNIERVDQEYTIRGYAYTGSGNEIARVEISNDDGLTWNETTLDKTLNQDQKHWAWTIWNVTIPVSKNDSFICRATDVNGNTQPSDISNKWNLRGLNNNTCHKKIYHDRNN